MSEKAETYQTTEEGFIILPKDAQGVLLPFETPKYKYKVIRPGNPLGIQRYLEFEKLQIPAGMGLSFAEIATTLRDIELLLGSDKPLAEVRLDAILKTNSLRRAIVDLSRTRFSKTLYLATIFIYREGDDPGTWDMDRATEYLEDWQEAGISEQDFFLLSLSLVSGFSKVYNDIKQEIEETQAGLSGTIQLTKQGDLSNLRTS